MRLLIFVFFILTISSCEKTEKVDDYPLHKSKLVANCLFTNDTNFIFHMFKSLSPLDNAPFNVLNKPGAYVKVYEDNVLFDSLVYNGMWRNYTGDVSKFPTPGKKYRFEAYHPGYPKLSAEELMPEDVNVKRFSFYNTTSQVYSSNDTSLYGNVFTNLNIEVEDRPKFVIIDIDKYIIRSGLPGSIRGFYGSSMLDALKEVSSTNTYYTAGTQIFITNSNGISNIALQWMNSYAYILNNNPVNGVDFKITQCSESSFEYLRRMALKAFNENDPFSEPIPITNNINNGFGVFAGLNYHTYSFKF